MDDQYVNMEDMLELYAKPKTQQEYIENSIRKGHDELSIGDLGVDHQIIYVGDIPDTVRKIYIGNYVPEMEEGAIPPSVTHMHIKMNGLVSMLPENIIPYSVTHLFLQITPDWRGNTVFNLEDWELNIPDSVTHVKYLSTIIDHYKTLPLSITHLYMKSMQNKMDFKRFINLKHLYIPDISCHIKLPQNLEYLYLEDDLQLKIQDASKKIIVPSTLRKIYSGVELNPENPTCTIKGDELFEKHFEVDHGIVKGAMY